MQNILELRWVEVTSDKFLLECPVGTLFNYLPISVPCLFSVNREEQMNLHKLRAHVMQCLCIPICGLILVTTELLPDMWPTSVSQLMSSLLQCGKHILIYFKFNLFYYYYCLIDRTLLCCPDEVQCYDLGHRRLKLLGSSESPISVSQIARTIGLHCYQLPLQLYW